jgi:hypothetical protein
MQQFGHVGAISWVKFWACNINEKITHGLPYASIKRIQSDTKMHYMTQKI